MLVPDDGIRKEAKNLARLRHKNFCLTVTVTNGLLLLLTNQYPVFFSWEPNIPMWAVAD